MLPPTAPSFTATYLSTRISRSVSFGLVASPFWVPWTTWIPQSNRSTLVLRYLKCEIKLLLKPLASLLEGEGVRRPILLVALHRHYRCMPWRAQIMSTHNYVLLPAQTTGEAETWGAWAAAYVDMEPEEHPNGSQALLLRQAKEQVRGRIDNDPSWVLTKIHPFTPRFYDPVLENSCALRNARHTAQQASVGSSTNAEAGPPSVTLDRDGDRAHAPDPHPSVHVDVDKTRSPDEIDEILS